MVFHQDLGERNPHVAGIAKSVQQDRRALAAKADVLSAAAHRHLLALKNSGPCPAACHASSPMNCRASIAGFAATSKTLEAYGADEPKAQAFSGISYIQISDPPEFVSKYANDLADDGSEKA